MSGTGYLTYNFDLMSDTPSSLPASPARRRPWWRLHISTCVIAFLTAVPFFFLIVPAWRFDGPDKSFAVYGHGWPLIWSETFGGSAWPYNNRPVHLHISNISIIALLFDVFFGLVVVTVLAGSNEALLRWRNRPWQFSLRTAFIAITVFCLLTGWWSFRYRDERAASNELYRLAYGDDDAARGAGPGKWIDDGPAWLQEWIGADNPHSPFVHVHAVIIRWDAIPDALPALARLPRLRAVSVVIDVHDSRKHQWQLDEIEGDYRYLETCRGIDELNAFFATLSPGCADELLPKLRAVATQLPDVEISVGGVWSYGNRVPKRKDAETVR